MPATDLPDRRLQRLQIQRAAQAHRRREVQRPVSGEAVDEVNGLLGR